MSKWILNRISTPPEPPAAARGAAPQEPRFSPARDSRGGRGAILAAIISAVILALVIWGVLSFRARRSGSETAATRAASDAAQTERREYARSLRAHGTVEAVNYYTIAAPRLAGQGLGSLVITFLVPTGKPVKKGDRLVEFDRQNQEKVALDRQAEFRDLEEQIKRRNAEHANTQSRDDTELRQAQNALASAELEMRKNEVISRIDAEKNAQTLEESKANLAQLRETFELKRLARKADLRVLEIQRDRARNAMNHARRNSEKMSIRSKMNGIAVLNSIFKGGQMSEVQEGDEVRAGVPFMQVVNPTAMQVRARINQADVTSLRVGQSVQIRLDAYPGLVFSGRLETLAAIGVTSGMNPKVRTFAATFSIKGTDARLLPDLSAAVDIDLDRAASTQGEPRNAIVRK